MNHHDLLEKVASQGLEHSSVEEIQSLALAFWHREFVPDRARVVRMEARSRAVAGYLVDFFSQFNCLADERGELLARIAMEIHSSLKPLAAASDNPHDTAGRWGLSGNIFPFLKYILDFQTRHYVLPPEEVA